MAVSDDKRDFITRLGINPATGDVPDAVIMALGPHFDDRQPDLAPPADVTLPEPWDHVRVVDLVGQPLPPWLDVMLGPFIKGLRRRLSRDQDRLHRYHNDLHHEAMRRASVLPVDDPKRTREEQRAAAIGREYHAKLDDLAQQYATRVTAQWVQTQEIVMERSAPAFTRTHRHPRNA